MCCLKGKVMAEDDRGDISVYVPGQPNTHDEETCTACIEERQEAEDKMCRHSSASLSNSDAELTVIPPMESEIEDIFVGCSLGADDSMDSGSDSGDDTDTEEVIHKSCS